MNFLDLIPRPTNRVFLTGMTGSGKSFLAEHLLLWRKSILIYDAKDEIKDKWKSAARYQKFTRLRDLVSANPDRAIYAPKISTRGTVQELDDPRFHDAFFKYGFLRRATTIYVDEAYAVTHGQELPFYYKAAITRGRSAGVEVWSATQRPIDIPQFLMSESENKYIFYQEMPQDVDKLRKMTGISEDLIRSLSMDNHEFIYRNRNQTSGILTLKGN